MNAVTIKLHVCETGCKWKHLAQDLGHSKTLRNNFFHLWRSKINLFLHLLAVAISQACHAKYQNATCWSFINPREKDRVKSCFLDKLPWVFLSNLFADDIIIHKNRLVFSGYHSQIQWLISWRKLKMENMCHPLLQFLMESRHYPFCCFCFFIFNNNDVEHNDQKSVAHSVVSV